MPEPRVVPADNRSQDSSPSRDSAAQTHTTSITRRTTWSGRSCSSERRRLALNSSAGPLVYSVSATTIVGAIPPQKNILFKALELTASVSQENDLFLFLFSLFFVAAIFFVPCECFVYRRRLSELIYVSATEISYPDLQMFFTTFILHVHLMQWEDENLIAQAINQCNVIWESIDPNQREQLLGLLFYNELPHMFYRLRICDYKNAAQHVDKLDAAMKADLQKMQQVQQPTSELNALNQSLSRPDLPSRERLHFSEQLASQELSTVNNVETRKLALIVFTAKKPEQIIFLAYELEKLGITDGATEVDLKHSAIWMAGVYLMLLMQFLENKVAVELTRSKFVEAQEVGVMPKLLPCLIISLFPFLRDGMQLSLFPPPAHCYYCDPMMFIL
ncbi:hypothetical protein Q3G72_008932 [Acer saccharum]|nr:hypothetical protein Q3G72_008932 [Acer saccharum]